MKQIITLESPSDGLGISTLVVRPEGNPYAVLQLAHGMRGCKERFLPFMEYLAGQGIAGVACDHRGHGASVRTRDDLGYMYAGGYKALVDDMKMASDWAREEFPGIPLYLLGHSMGSMAARVYAKKYDSGIDGLILCGSPSWNPAAPAGLLISRFLCLFREGRMRPRLMPLITSGLFNRKFAAEGPQAWTCSDPVVRKEFADNPLCNFRFTANANMALLNLMVETYSSKGWTAAHTDMPVYFISGADDPCMNGEKKFHAAAGAMCRAGYTDVTSAIFPAMRHEVLNETGKETVWNDISRHIREWTCAER